MSWYTVIPVIVVCIIAFGLQKRKSNRQEQLVKDMSKGILIVYLIGVLVFLGIIILSALTFS